MIDRLVRNPVLSRELKERLRTRRATIVVTVYLGILSLILYALYRAEEASSADPFSGPVASQAADVGRTMFEVLVLVMLGLVLFIVPGLTADAVTGERERQTLVPLQVTLLRPRAIVAGKLLASLAFVSLLVLATLPLFGISFILGGVSVGQVAKGVAAVLATGVVVASLSLLCSSLARRTQGAMVLAYGLALFLAVGAPVLYVGQRSVDDSGAHPAPTVLLLNPFVATADALAPPTDGGGFGSSSPLAGMSQVVRGLETGFDDGQVIAEQEFGDEQAGRGFAGPGQVVVLGDAGGRDQGSSDGLLGIPFWVRSLGVLGFLTVLSLLVATRRITTPSDRTAS